VALLEQRVADSIAVLHANLPRPTLRSPANGLAFLWIHLRLGAGVVARLVLVALLFAVALAGVAGWHAPAAGLVL